MLGDAGKPRPFLLVERGERHAPVVNVVDVGVEVWDQERDVLQACEEEYSHSHTLQTRVFSGKGERGGMIRVAFAPPLILSPRLIDKTRTAHRLEL